MSLFQRGLKCLDDAIVAKKLAQSDGSGDAKADSKSAGAAAAGAAGTDAKTAAAEGKGEAAKPAGPIAGLASSEVPAFARPLWACENRACTYPSLTASSFTLAKPSFDCCCAQRCCTAWAPWRCRSAIRSRAFALLLMHHLTTAC